MILDNYVLFVLLPVDFVVVNEAIFGIVIMLNDMKPMKDDDDDDSTHVSLFSLRYLASVPCAKKIFVSGAT